MMIIDGSEGHGGGQIIRTATALSAITGKSFTMKNIRVNRKKPGLRPQHLHGIKTVARLCNAKLHGAEENSTSIEFVPNKPQRKKLEFDPRTAGSITLALQTILLPCFNMEHPVKITAKGGTNVMWSPTIDYFSNVTLPLIKKMGFNAESKLKKRGYYPKGGGLVEVTTHPAKPSSMELLEKGEVLALKGLSHASQELKKACVAERQAEAVEKALCMDVEHEIKIEYSETQSVGTSIQLWLETENTVLGANALGEKGVPAEKIGKRAAKKLLEQKGAVDEWSTDQLIPYMALAGNSQIKASKITEHCKSNIAITERFTGKKFIVKNQIIKVGE